MTSSPAILGPLTAARFVWNDDCPSWPVRLTADGSAAYVTAAVLLAMIRATATNTVNGSAFVDDEDAVESCAAIARSPRTWYDSRLLYDVTRYVVNTGAMEPDLLTQAGFEDLDDGMSLGAYTAEEAHNAGKHDGNESMHEDYCPTCHYATTGEELGR